MNGGSHPTRYWKRGLLGLGAVALLWAIPATHAAHLAADPALDQRFDLGLDLVINTCALAGTIALFYSTPVLIMAILESSAFLVGRGKAP